MDLEKFGIRANSVIPGLVRIDFGKGRFRIIRSGKNFSKGCLGRSLVPKIADQAEAAEAESAAYDVNSDVVTNFGEESGE